MVAAAASVIVVVTMFAQPCPLAKESLTWKLNWLRH
jgi:hypothetical protein